jgi:hypothetical protein
VKVWCIVGLALALAGCAIQNPRARALNAEEAERLAQQLANDKSRELYQCEPFQEARPAQMEQGRWVWRDRRGWGSGDIEATVKFAADGSAPEVKVFRLFNETR